MIINPSNRKNNTTSHMMSVGVCVAVAKTQQADLPSSSKPLVSVLFQTKFTNNTDGVQEYTMRTEKKTKTTLSTNIEQGYTRGVEMSVKLSAPGEVNLLWLLHIITFTSKPLHMYM